MPPGDDIVSSDNVISRPMALMITDFRQAINQGLRYL